MSEKTKSVVLGESFTTARGKLRKMLLFNLAQKLDLDICFRCTLKIDTIEEFSTEHKEAWQSAEDPVEAFYDLDNVAFSHIVCNNEEAATRHRKYESITVYKAEGWKRYYAKNKEQVLTRKRDKYRDNQGIA